MYHLLRQSTYDSMNRKSTSAKSTTGSALDAVALQDHLKKQLGLKTIRVSAVKLPGSSRSLPTATHDASRPHVRTATPVSNGGATVASASRTPLTTHDALLVQLTQVRECDSCGAACKSSESRCPACERPLPAIAARDKAAPLSLAQQRGLVHGPTPLLTEAQWEAVEARAVSRSDSSCPICLQSLGMREQVLTSCSHTFHAACLNNMQRFMGQRCCPVCRTQGYQRRRTRQGAYKHVLACVTRIQSVWRGYSCRERYWALRKKFYLTPTRALGQGAPQAGVDPARRRAFLGELLGDLHVHIAAGMASRRGAVDSLLSDSDAAVAASRRVLLAATARLEAGERGSGQTSALTRAPIPLPGAALPQVTTSVILEQLAARLLAAESRQEQVASTRAMLAQARLTQARQASRAQAARDKTGDSSAPVLSAREWRIILQGARSRGHMSVDCAVCMVALEETQERQGADCALLSCGHIYHGQCIESFEAFTTGRGLSGRAAEPPGSSATAMAAGGEGEGGTRCPLCRAQYSRISLQEVLAAE